MSWVSKLRGIIGKNRKETAKKKNTSGSAMSWYQQINNGKAKVKDRNRKRRRLARLQRQRSIR